MAKDDAQNVNDAQPRVYKASKVHKRRADKLADKPEETQPDETGADADQGDSRESEPEAPAVPAADETAEPTEDEQREEADDEDSTGPTRRSVKSSPAARASRETGGAKHPRLAWQIASILGVAVVAVLLMFVGYFTAARWFVYDDQASIQGTWFIAGTSVPITITEDTIVLDSKTSYEYEIDATAKTITYRFGDLEGQGRYWFSSDRHYLVITDGAGYTTWSTMTEDLSRFAGDLVADVFGGGASLPSDEDSLVLSLTPTVNLDASTSAQPVEAPDVSVDATSAYDEPEGGDDSV